MATMSPAALACTTGTVTFVQRRDRAALEGSAWGGEGEGRRGGGGGGEVVEEEAVLGTIEIIAVSM